MIPLGMEMVDMSLSARRIEYVLEPARRFIELINADKASGTQVSAGR